VNLGGFANFSEDRKGIRLAGDICSCNYILNRLAIRKGAEYDRDGKWASEGEVIADLLDALNRATAPLFQGHKSMGREWVERDILPLFKSNYKTEDLLATHCEHIAQSIAEAIQQTTRVLITGGGVHNSYLMNRISYYLSQSIPSATREIIDFKEALVFALLAYKRVLGEVNCLGSATGARHSHSTGVIFYPK
jgi:anhydro-N-acetylmuramic acid kinase